MTDFTKRIIFIVLYWISESRLISALDHYCEWGICKEEEECCGPNKCCTPTNNISYLHIILLSILVGLLVIYISIKLWKLYRFFTTDPESDRLIRTDRTDSDSD